jgi:hypothetical protein
MNVHDYGRAVAAEVAALHGVIAQELAAAGIMATREEVGRLAIAAAIQKLRDENAH